MSNENKAIVYVLIAYVSIAIMGIFVKFASATVPSSEILFVRFFLGAIFLLPFVVKTKQLKINFTKPQYFILRNAAGISAMLLMFYIIKHLPVAIAILLMNTSALFVPIILLFLGIRTTLTQVILISLGFIGVCVILLGSHSQAHIDNFYVFIGIVSAILAAIAYCSLQELNKYNSPQNIVFYFHTIGFLSIALIFGHDWVWVSLSSFILLICVGIFGLSFQIYVTKAFKYASASTLTPFTFIGVVFSGLFDAFIVKDHLPTTFWIGALIIVIAVSLLAKDNAKRAKLKKLAENHGVISKK
ncbi:DMT family transporter [Actinobacillus delphinicola]|uniref:Putative permease n=1 Tax=Actinobacillus delphinicola TaxID=51161 RepID=A0A448TSE1_9PAST|nr:DMT family transporter [Actinobacillus delphinicola]VEJ08909.1 putative permease [Actinobacillus delphinicola]